MELTHDIMTLIHVDYYFCWWLYLSGEPTADDEASGINHVDIYGIVECTQLCVDWNRPESHYTPADTIFFFRKSENEDEFDLILFFYQFDFGGRLVFRFEWKSSWNAVKSWE
jgi:hypothetical protein